MRILVVDTETTGLSHDTDRVCELAVVPLIENRRSDDPDDLYWRPGTGEVTFVNPERDIPAEASAIHHIEGADVIGAPTLKYAMEDILPLDAIPPTPKAIKDIVFAAHNAPFDLGFLPQLKPYRWIDTYRCAKHIWPDAPSHSNMTLYYWLGLRRDDPDQRSMRGRAHNALSDASVTALLLCRMLQEASVDALVEIGPKPILLRTVHFGQHHGKKYSELDVGMLKWILDRDFEPDVIYTAKTELARRSKQPEVVKHDGD